MSGKLLELRRSNKMMTLFSNILMMPIYLSSKEEDLTVLLLMSLRLDSVLSWKGEAILLISIRAGRRNHRRLQILRRAKGRQIQRN